MKLRFGLRAKLVAVALALAPIPWLGYRYVKEMEAVLRKGLAEGAVDGLDGHAHALPARCARMTSRYQSKDRLGVRTCVSKSTCTSPNRWVRP